MRRIHWISSGILIALLLALIGGLVWTRDSGPPAGLAARLQKKGKKVAQPARKERTVDTSLLLAARKLGSQAGSAEEQELARQAERLASHELTQSFTMALKRTAEAPTARTPEMKELAALKARAEEAVEADQRRIKELERRLAKAPEEQRQTLEDQIEVAKAQLELDRDERDSAREDLDQAGGDSQARIKRLKEAYDAMDREPSTIGQASASLVARGTTGSLLNRLRLWRFQKEKTEQLARARQDLQGRAQRLIAWRDKLAQRIKDESAQRSEARHSASGFGQGDSGSGKRATLDTLKQFMARQQVLSSANKRIQDLQALDEVYDSWGQLATTYRRGAAHLLLKGLLNVLIVLMVVFLLHRAVERLFRGLAKEKLRATTMQSVIKFLILLLGLLVIVLMTTGLPAQTATLLGLLGAGLTLALRNFIVAFFGWFVLMGKNGVRVGDWVEINGVGGEVVELGLLRTILMETGSWNELGHPTGRKVAFVNSYAVEGHFFNFSTTGQWMWDELQLVIPLGTNPYPIIEGVQKLVAEKTEANTREAEAEWQKATTRYRVRTFSAVPGINVTPSALGVEVRVRYITRAYERHSTRKALSEAVLALMHGRSQADS